MPLQVRGQLPKEVLERVTRDRLDFIIVSLRTYEKLEVIGDKAPEPTRAEYWGVPHARTEVEAQDGHAIIRHIYEGLMSSHGADKRLYEFLPSFDEVPIQAHPNFDNLRREFGGYWDANGNFKFPAQKPSATGGKGGFAQLDRSASLGAAAVSVGGGGEPTNMQGVDSFLRMGGVFRVSYAVKEPSLPSSLFNGVGTVKSPPDKYKIPGIPSGRNWLKGPPTARWRGNAWDVTEEYILSGLGGWNKKVYDGRTEMG